MTQPAQARKETFRSVIREIERERALTSIGRHPAVMKASCFFLLYRRHRFYLTAQADEHCRDSQRYIFSVRRMPSGVHASSSDDIGKSTLSDCPVTGEFCGY